LQDDEPSRLKRLTKDRNDADGGEHRQAAGAAAQADLSSLKCAGQRQDAPPEEKSPGCHE
jgi:hypothetical protein